MEMNDGMSPNEKTEFLERNLPEEKIISKEDTAKETPAERRLRYTKLLGILLGVTMAQQNEGLATTWPNVFASDMQTDRTTFFNTTLHVSSWEMDMMSSSLFIGTMPAIVFSGWLVTCLGRRKSMIIAALPGVTSWVIVSLAPSISVILTGRFIIGAAYGLLGIAVRSYIAEISDIRIRGAAGVTTEAMKGIGGIGVITLGIFIPWYYVAFFCACHFLVYGLLVVPFLPESPSFLVVREREKEAVKVLRYLKGPDVDVDVLIKNLKRENERADGSHGWRVLLKPDILKKYFIIIGLFFISNFSGVEVIRGNATRMLQTSDLALDKDISTIIVFVVLLCGVISQTLILDKIGRRKCLLISLTLLLFAYTFLGTYIFLNTSDPEKMDLPVRENMTTFQNDISSATENKWNWLPAACLMVVAFGSSLGIGPIPWLLSTEYFPTTIRPQVLAVCSISANVMTIASLQLYSPLQLLLSPAGLYWCYASCSALGIVFTLIFVYETKGISIG